MEINWVAVGWIIDMILNGVVWLVIAVFSLILIGYGINDYISGKSLGGDYLGTLIMLIAILPGTLHIQNKE